MKITEEVREAIRKKCQEESGGGVKLAREAGFTPAQINRYHSGKTKTMTEECWSRLFPFVLRYLPDGFTCKVLVDGKLETRIVRQHRVEKTTWQWDNSEYSRLFGSSLPTRDQIEQFLVGKIKSYGNEMNLLLFLLNFDEVMNYLEAHSSGAAQPREPGQPD